MSRRSRSDQAGPTRILVVDDDPNGRELIARILESAGWKADRCSSEGEALVQLGAAQPPYKAVVVDFTSGTTSSVQLLGAIRGRDEIAGLPVVLLTTSTDGQVFAWQSGVDGFLVRPFHADDLINEVYAVLSRTPSEREEYRTEKLRAIDGG